MDATTQTTAEALEEYLGETSPHDNGYRLERIADGVTTGSIAGERWWKHERKNLRVVVTDEDGIEVHGFTGANMLHVWTARYQAGTPVNVIIAGLQEVPAAPAAPVPARNTRLTTAAARRESGRR